MADLAGCDRSVVQFAIFLLSVSSAFGAEHFIVTHSPDYVGFLPNGGKLAMSQVPDLITATYGLSPARELLFTGLTQGDLFRRPKANVLFSIPGFVDKYVDLNLFHQAKYPADSDVASFSTQSVSDRLQNIARNPLIIDFSTDSTAFDLKARHPDMFGDVAASLDKVREQVLAGTSPLSQYSLGSLNASNDADLQLLGELQLVHEVIQALKTHSESVKDNIPDFYHFKLDGLAKLVETYKSGSHPVYDGAGLLRQFLTQATDEFKKLYDGNVIIEVVTMSGTARRGYVRKGRSLMQSEDEEPSLEDLINVSDSYSENYSAIFNIILWTMIVLAVTILAISCGMWNMDPGRDSIIYRMTSQRMKKD